MNWLWHILNIVIVFALPLWAYRLGIREGFRDGRTFAQQYCDAWWVIQLRKHGYDAAVPVIWKEVEAANAEQAKRDASGR